MNPKKIIKRKVELEGKFKEVVGVKAKLVAQAKGIVEAIKLVDGEVAKVQGAYAEICGLLGLDVKKESERIQKEMAGGEKPAKTPEGAKEIPVPKKKGAK